MTTSVLKADEHVLNDIPGSSSLLQRGLIPVAIHNVSESKQAAICLPIFMCQALLMLKKHQAQQGRKTE